MTMGRNLQRRQIREMAMAVEIPAVIPETTVPAAMAAQAAAVPVIILRAAAVPAEQRPETTARYSCTAVLWRRRSYAAGCLCWREEEKEENLHK